MSKSWTAGSTRRWREIRRIVLVRDGYRCQLRLEGCTVRATCVHHKLGREVSGDDPEELVAACEPCNQRIGDPRRQDPAPAPRTKW